MKTKVDKKSDTFVRDSPHPRRLNMTDEIFVAGIRTIHFQELLQLRATGTRLGRFDAHA